MYYLISKQQWTGGWYILGSFCGQESVAYNIVGLVRATSNCSVLFVVSFSSYVSVKLLRQILCATSSIPAAHTTAVTLEMLTYSSLNYYRLEIQL